MYGYAASATNPQARAATDDLLNVLDRDMSTSGTTGRRFWSVA